MGTLVALVTSPKPLQVPCVLAWLVAGVVALLVGW